MEMKDVYKDTLHACLSSDEHSARTREALEISGSSYADKAEEVLKNAPKDKLELMRARELAQHYRWKAAKRNPIRYSEKVQQDINVKTEAPLFGDTNDESSK